MHAGWLNGLSLAFSVNPAVAAVHIARRVQTALAATGSTARSAIRYGQLKGWCANNLPGVVIWLGLQSALISRTKHDQRAQRAVFA